MTSLLLLAGLGVAAAAGLVLLDALIRRPDIVAWAVLGLVLLEALLGTNKPSLLVGGFRIEPDDVFFSLIFGAATARYLRLRHISVEQWALVAFAAAVVLSLLTGLATLDFAGAVNESRSYLRFVAGALYFSTVPVTPEARARVANAWLWAGVALAAIVLLRWAGRFGGIELGVLDATYDAAIRVLDGSQTFFLATCAVVALLPAFEDARDDPRERWLGAFLLIMVIVLNRRTVWLAVMAALVALLLRNPAVGRKVALVGVIGAVLFAATLPFLPGAAGEDRPVAQGVTDTGTLVWRLEGWSALLGEGPDEPNEYLFGLPFGSGYTRLVAGQERESNPHSYYVQTFLRGGAIGLGGLLLAMYLAFSAVARRRAGGGGPLSRGTLFLLLIMQATWYITWPPGAEQGIVLGLAVAFAKRDRLAEDDGAAAPTAGRPQPANMNSIAG